MSTSHQTLLALIDAAFSKDGYFFEQGLAYREAQHAYALSIGEWLIGSRPVAAINGETGIGKSLGYLVPLLAFSSLTGQRVAISTYTIALQRQLMERDLPVAAEYLAHAGIEMPTIARRLGRNHYVSKRRAAEVAGRIQDDTPGWFAQAAQRFITWALTSGSGLIEEWISEHGELPGGLSAHDVCLTQGCDDEDSARFLRDAENSRDAQVVITSHAVCVLNALHGQGILARDDEMPISTYLFDEGDKVPYVATSQTRTLISPRQMSSLAHGLRSVTRHAGARSLLDSAIDNLDKMNAMLGSIGHNHSERVMLWEKLSDERRSELNALLNQAKSAFSKLRGMSAKVKGLALHERTIADAVQSFGRWSERDGSRLIQWSPVRQYPSLAIEPLHAGRLMRALFAPKQEGQQPAHCCFTSATLAMESWDRSLSDPFKSFLDEVGAWGNSVAFTRSFSPTHYGQLSFRFINPSTPAPFADAESEELSDGRHQILLNDQWLKATAALITRAVAGGNTLVLTGSHMESRALAARLSLGVPVYVQDADQPLSQATSHFQRTGGVLIAAGAWEGFSARATNGGQLFTELVITRIPIRPDSESYQAALNEEFARKGISADRARQVGFISRRVEALRKLRQGLGRGIRDALDEVTVWIADPRFDMPGGCQGRHIGGSRFAIPRRFAGAWKIGAVEGHGTPEASIQAPKARARIIF